MAQLMRLRVELIFVDLELTGSFQTKDTNRRYLFSLENTNIKRWYAINDSQEQEGKKSREVVSSDLG